MSAVGRTVGGCLALADARKLRRVKELAAEGKPVWLIAERVGLSEDEVRNRADWHRIRLTPDREYLP